MEMTTQELLNNVESQIEEASRGMSLDEKEELYNKLHDWAYRMYEETLIESYEGGAEKQDYEEED